MLTQQELESRLWDAANSLRGPVDPADFKAYIFPLLFFKWIFAEYAPDTTPEIVARIVERVDSIAGQVRGTGWQESQPMDKRVRREIRKVLRDYSLPLSGELYNRAYAYVRENY